jgi:translation initiation factor 4A
MSAESDDGDHGPDTFDDMQLRPALLRGVYAYGFEHPSDVQRRCVAPLIGGADVVCQARFGTGRTAAYAIALLQRTDWARHEATQAVVAVPTRELEYDVTAVIATLGEYLAPEGRGRGSAAPAVLGLSLVPDLRGWPPSEFPASAVQRCTVCIGTPERLVAALQDGALRLAAAHTLIVDDVDGLPGLTDDLYRLFVAVPSGCALGFMTTTLPRMVLALVDRFLRSPVRVVHDVRHDELTLDGVKQFFVACDAPVGASSEEFKLEMLLDLYESVGAAQSVVFVNTRQNAEWLHARLAAKGHVASVAHGDVTQGDAQLGDAAVRAFREGATRVLVLTNVLARSVDVGRVPLVVNFHLPCPLGYYLDRVGRSGACGRKGVALNFIAGAVDADHMRALEAYYNTTVDELPMNFAEML